MTEEKGGKGGGDFAMQFLASLLGTEGGMNLISEQGFQEEWLDEEDERPAYLFIRTFYVEHSRLPSRGLVEERRGLSLPEAPEPLAFYVEELRKRALHRVFVSNWPVIRGLLEKQDPDQAFTILAEVVHQGFQQARARRVVDISEKSAKILVAESYERAKTMGGMTGIPSPWPTLNELNAGFQPGELVTVVARTGMGKTYCLLLLAHHAWAAAKRRVLFVSMEMSRLVMLRRLYGVHAGIAPRSLMRGELTTEEEQRFYHSLEGLSEVNTPFTLVDEFDGTATGLKLLIDEYAPEFVLVDGFYLMKPHGKYRVEHERVGNLVHELHLTAKKADVPLVISTQFNREVKAFSTVGEVANLAGSDKIGQLSRLILALFRTKRMQKEGVIQLAAMKVTEGESFKRILLHWNFPHMQFHEVEGEAARRGEDRPNRPRY